MAELHEITKRLKKIKINTIVRKLDNNINELKESNNYIKNNKRKGKNNNINSKIKLDDCTNALKNNKFYPINTIPLINIFNFHTYYKKLDEILKIFIILFINISFSLSINKQRYILFTHLKLL